MPEDNARANQLFVPSEFRHSWSSALSANHTVPRPVSVREIPLGMVLPLREAPPGDSAHWRGGVVSPDGEFIAGHRQTNEPLSPGARDVIEAYPLDSPPLRVHETVVFGGGRDARHYGHFLIEMLSRLWWVTQNRSALRVAFTTHGLRPDYPALELIVRCGIPQDRIILVEEPMQFDSVIVPDQAMYLRSGLIDHTPMRHVFETIRSSVEHASELPDKVFFSNSAYNRKAYWGLSFLDDFHSARGFTVVHPETLSVSDQIALLSHASEFSAPEGTLAHQVALCPDGVQFSMITRAHAPGPVVQWGLNEMRSAKSRIVDCSIDLMPTSHFLGTHLFAQTTHFCEFALECFGDSISPHQFTPDEIVQYLHEWALSIAKAPARKVKYLRTVPTLTPVALATRLLAALPSS